MAQDGDYSSPEERDTNETRKNINIKYKVNMTAPSIFNQDSVHNIKNDLCEREIYI